MARHYVPPPQYVQTIQHGYDPNGIDGGAAYRNAVGEHYNSNYQALVGSGGSYGTVAYDPQQAAAYARNEQQRYQGGPAVSSAALGQAAYDRAQRQNLQSVGAQRGAGGQAQGIRAAMMGTTQASGAQSQAQTQSTAEQVAQRQAILQQRLATEAQQGQADRDFQAEKDRFNKEREENDGDTTSGMMKIAGSAIGMMSDERTKVKKTRAPSLVIMLGTGKEGYC